jgi:repressor LexA
MNIGRKRLPMLGNIACGEPIYAEEEHESYVAADSSLDADFCLRAQGDSMTGARIYDGDIVFIRSQDAVDNGEIAAVIINDEATLKRVYYYPEEEKLILSPENPRYAPLVYIKDELNSIKIIGKAVAFQSCIM